MHILLCEDEESLGMLVREYLQAKGYDAELYLDGEAGYKAFMRTKFDMCLLDVMMPKMNGFEVCKNIRQAKLSVPVLMLTAKGTIDDKTTGFDCGADDYLVKPFDIQEVLLRIRVLLRRNAVEVEESPLSNEVLKCGDIEIFPESLECIIINRRVKLTPTEFEILYCLMQHFNSPVTLATLLDEVWGYDSNEDVRMLRVHVGGLRNKIETDAKSPKYLHTVTNVGYKLTPFVQE